MVDVKTFDEFHLTDDPWDYEKNKDDIQRRNILLEKLENYTFINALDIGCGQGFITRYIPSRNITGVDISNNAVKHAKRKNQNKNINFKKSSIFDLSTHSFKYDLIIINGLLYKSYVGNSKNLIYLIIDKLLESNGILISCHIIDWSRIVFPYFLIDEEIYQYRQFYHHLQVYKK